MNSVMRVVVATWRRRRGSRPMRSMPRASTGSRLRRPSIDMGDAVQGLHRWSRTGGWCRRPQTSMRAGPRDGQRSSPPMPASSPSSADVTEARCPRSSSSCDFGVAVEQGADDLGAGLVEAGGDELALGAPREGGAGSVHEDDVAKRHGIPFWRVSGVVARTVPILAEAPGSRRRRRPALRSPGFRPGGKRWRSSPFQDLRRRQPLLRGRGRLHPAHGPQDAAPLHGLGGAPRPQGAAGGGHGEPLHPEPDLRPRRTPGLPRRLLPGQEPEGPLDSRRLRGARADPPGLPRPRRAPGSHGRAGHARRLLLPDPRGRHGGGTHERPRSGRRRLPRLQPLAPRRLGLLLRRTHLRDAVHDARRPRERDRRARVGARARRARDRDAAGAGARAGQEPLDGGPRTSTPSGHA